MFNICGCNLLVVSFTWCCLKFIEFTYKMFFLLNELAFSWFFRFFIEHQQDSFKEKWDNSGATEHSLTCHRQFNWIHPKTIARENDYRRRKMREGLEIKKAKYNKKIKVLNRDEGNLVKTNTWAPLLANINEL